MEVLEKILLAEQTAKKMKEEALSKREQVINTHKQEAQESANKLLQHTEAEISKIRENTKEELTKLTLDHERKMNEIKEKVLIASESKKDKCIEIIINKVIRT